MDFDEMTNKQKHIYVWVKFMDYEFRMCIENYSIKGYTLLINDYINPILFVYLFKNKEKTIELCREGTMLVKDINGNHFHMYLFLELEKMIQKL